MCSSSTVSFYDSPSPKIYKRSSYDIILLAEKKPLFCLFLVCSQYLTCNVHSARSDQILFFCYCTLTYTCPLHQASQVPSKYLTNPRKIINFSSDVKVIDLLEYIVIYSFYFCYSYILQITYDTV